MTGQVIKIHSDFFFLNVQDKIISCKVRGILKRDKIFVGDFVEINSDMIEKILPRKNFMNRPAVSNIDKIIVTFAAKNPNLHKLVLDKFLVLAELAKIPEIIICINKTDLIDDKNFLHEYENLYRVVRVSSLNNENISELKKILSSGVNIFAGPSGVGKSSLLNSIDENFNLKVGSLSEKILRGKNTTRTVELIKFCDGFLADTPGFTAVNLKKLSIDEKNLRNCFKEFRNFSDDCKFQNCSHSHEPNCAVKKAVADKKILPERYENYLTMLEESK